ncbi:hypothetical protein SAMN05892883_2436 [Jatrophihabitans sp. GAS493]|uniref:hypothetical protein n=1 Tax=Jatrophihabitans sp. GAS493 TaxID=1907575 RepID=UPI000BB8B33B|nr:hypothetical protein [Jatrophihabitans sp. GAS493]SOD73147.1 hypothetical protein SAMN05892883_2436 [Jatrophihabitans sp. GAS493]
MAEATRWQGLFADLEAQADALAAAHRAAEVEDQVRIEVGRLRLIDRLRPADGGTIRLMYPGAVVVSGELLRVGPDWLLLDEGSGRDALALLTPLLSIGGLGRLAAVPDTESIVESRLGLAHALRGIARDRSAVRIELIDGSTLDGTVDRVGRDFLELATHAPGELRRRSEVREVLAVPFSAVAVLRRASG